MRFLLSPCHKARIIAGACIVCTKNCEPVIIEANGYISERNDSSFGTLILIDSVGMVEDKYTIIEVKKGGEDINVLYYEDGNPKEQELTMPVDTFKLLAAGKKWWDKTFYLTFFSPVDDEDFEPLAEDQVKEVNTSAWNKFYNSIDVNFFDRWKMDTLIANYQIIS